MKPVLIVYECEFCGETFAREVDQVKVDEGENVAVTIKFADHDNEGPLCDHCLKDTAEETE
jgi:hypothetical protein